MKDVRTGLYKKIGCYGRTAYYHKYIEIRLERKILESKMKKLNDFIIQRRIAMLEDKTYALKLNVESLERTLETGKMLFRGMTFDEIYLEFEAKYRPAKIKEYIFYYLDRWE